MTYTYTKTFGSAVLAPCLQALCDEIAASPRYRVLTNLGEIGDTSHQAQGYSSDHNPFIVGPPGSDYPGMGYVRAIDLGGDAALLLELRDTLHHLYIAQDPRVYPFGYFKGPDSQISDWFGTGYHYDTGDEGHLHISVTQADGYNPSPSGWVPALDSRARWGIDTTTTPTPVTPSEEDDDMQPFLIQSDKNQGGNGGIGIVSQGAEGLVLKVVHTTAAVTQYQKLGFKGPAPVSGVEFNSYPKVGS